MTYKIPPEFAKYPEYSQENMAKMDKEAHVVMLIKGKKDDGVTPFYAYIKVIPSKMLWIRELQKTGQDFKVEDLGEIIKTGDTENPPGDIVREMQEKWNFDPNFEEKETKRLREFIEKKEKERLMAKIAEMKKKPKTES